jgi:hypothetical protein
MENLERYTHLNKYLKDKFGERTLKICIDGHFTCPNRDGTCGTGGCIFCSQKGSGDHIKNNQTITNSNVTDNIISDNLATDTINSHNLDSDNLATDNLISDTIKSITNQVENYFKSYKSERANKFIVYFQNFSNTYDSIQNLKLKYDAALINEKIVGISIATRPDCINEDIVKLISSYSKKYYVSVELGLQTSNDETGKFINRGYNSSQFSEAVKLLNAYSIDVICHIMVGLPNETFEDLKQTVNFVNSHNIQGLKIHSTYVIKNTKLAELYQENKYTPISLDDYLESLVYIVTHINPNIVIHRISGDAPKDLLIAPEWNSHKKLVLNGFDRIMRERNLKQGMYFSN